MMKLVAIFGIISAVSLAACATAPNSKTADTLTRTEAKQAACPESVLEAGASAADCMCVAKRLYEIGQKPGAIKYDNAAPTEDFGGTTGKRDIAIGILRLDAFEYCGMFDPEHEVSKNL